MKVEKKVAKKVFVPIELTLTVESDEEFLTLIRLCGADHTNANKLGESNGWEVVEIQTVKDFLGKIHGALS
jgi:hypothetical protein